MLALYRARAVHKNKRKFVADLIHRRFTEDDILTEGQKERADKYISDCIETPADNFDKIRKKMEEIYPAYRFRKIRELLDLLLVVGAVAFGIRGLFFQPFKIPTGSMQPTLYGIHYMVKDGSTNPNLAKFNNFFNYIFFSAMPVKAITIAESGYFKPNTLQTQSSFWSDITSFEIGKQKYTTPGTAKTVLEYTHLTTAKRYIKDDVLCKDGFISLGDHLFVERFSIYLTPLKRGDIMVFNTQSLRYNERNLSEVSGFYYVKRLAGMPGDTLKIEHDTLMVKPKGEDAFKPIYELSDTFKKIYSGKGGYQGHLGLMGEVIGQLDQEYVVPDNSYFMMGDNSKFSLDSRFFGAVPRENMVGKAFFVFWPFSRRWGLVDNPAPVDQPTDSLKGKNYYEVMFLQ